MLRTRRFWLGLTVSVGFLILFLWKLDFERIGTELRDANYAYLFPAILVYFCAFGFRSLRWRYLLLHLKAVPATRLYPVVSIGYLANNILPVRLGEFVRAHFLGEREGITKASALSTIAVERVFDGLTLLFFAAVVLPFLPWTDVLKNDSGEVNTLWVVASVAIALLFVVGFLVLFLFATSPALARRLALIVTSVSPRGLRPKAESLVYLLIDGLGALRSPRRLLLISLLSIPVWLTEAAMYYILARSFDLDVGFEVILVVTATSNLATAIPSSIGGIGPFEVVAKSTLVAFGVAAEPAAAYAFFVHIIALWLPVNVLGLMFLWKENISLSQLIRTRHIDMTPPPGLSAPGGGVAEYGPGGTEWDGGVVATEGEEE